jgi:hypothetical protein
MSATVKATMNIRVLRKVEYFLDNSTTISFSTEDLLQLFDSLALLFSISLWDWSGTKSTVTADLNWPIAPALDDRW